MRLTRRRDKERAGLLVLGSGGFWGVVVEVGADAKRFGSSLAKISAADQIRLFHSSPFLLHMHIDFI